MCNLSATIFKVSIEEGGYGEPVNLGDKINSSGKEFSPYIDGDVIYFSSDRAGGFGKLDVYASKTDDSVFDIIFNYMKFDEHALIATIVHIMKIKNLV